MMLLESAMRFELQLYQNGTAGIQNGTGIEFVIEQDVGGTRTDVCVRCRQDHRHHLAERFQQVYSI